MSLPHDTIRRTENVWMISLLCDSLLLKGMHVHLKSPRLPFGPFCHCVLLLLLELFPWHLLVSTLVCQLYFYVCISSHCLNSLHILYHCVVILYRIYAYYSLS